MSNHETPREYQRAAQFLRWVAGQIEDQSLPDFSTVRTFVQPVVRGEVGAAELAARLELDTALSYIQEGEADPETIQDLIENLALLEVLAGESTDRWAEADESAAVAPMEALRNFGVEALRDFGEAAGAEGLRAKIGELVGEASGCWDRLDRAGAFEAERAIGVIDRLVDLVREEKAALDRLEVFLGERFPEEVARSSVGSVEVAIRLLERVPTRKETSDAVARMFDTFQGRRAVEEGTFVDAGGAPREHLGPEDLVPMTRVVRRHVDARGEVRPGSASIDYRDYCCRVCGATEAGPEVLEKTGQRRFWHSRDLCSACSWEVSDTYGIVVATGMLVREDGKVLLERRAANPDVPAWSEVWGFPGGKCEGGESTLAVLRREWREELDAEVLDLTLPDALVYCSDYRALGAPTTYRTVTYRLEMPQVRRGRAPLTGLPRTAWTSRTAAELRWVDPEDAIADLHLIGDTAVILRRELAARALLREAVKVSSTPTHDTVPAGPSVEEMVRRIAGVGAGVAGGVADMLRSGGASVPPGGEDFPAETGDEPF